MVADHTANYVVHGGRSSARNSSKNNSSLFKTMARRASSSTYMHFAKLSVLGCRVVCPKYKLFIHFITKTLVPKHLASEYFATALSSIIFSYQYLSHQNSIHAFTFRILRNNYCNSKGLKNKNDRTKSLYFGSNYFLSVLSGLIYSSCFCIRYILGPKKVGVWF